jgi:hypothetical protein
MSSASMRSVTREPGTIIGPVGGGQYRQRPAAVGLLRSIARRERSIAASIFARVSSPARRRSGVMCSSARERVGLLDVGAAAGQRDRRGQRGERSTHARQYFGRDVVRRVVVRGDCTGALPSSTSSHIALRIANETARPMPRNPREVPHRFASFQWMPWLWRMFSIDTRPRITLNTQPV